MTLVLEPEQLEQIRAHARSTYPEECIGILGGTFTGEGSAMVKTVAEVRCFPNARADSRHNRSEIAPIEILKLDREYRKRKLTMVAFYHSHPDHPCRPSEFDRQHAMPFHSYVIVKIDQGEPVDVTSWTLQEDGGGFDSEPIQI